MATEFTFLRGLKANLPSGTSIVDGALYFCTDSLEIYEGYIDGTTSNKNLRRYGGVNTVACSSSSSPNYASGDTVLPTSATHGVIYYCTKDNILAAYDVTSSQWIQINIQYSTFSTDKDGLVPGPVETTDDGKFLGTGGWTQITGADVILTGYKIDESSGSEITAADTVNIALGKLEKTLKTIVSTGGEPNQNAISKITVAAKSDSDTVMTGDTTSKTIESSSTTDTVTLEAADKWTAITADPGTKTVKIGHSGSVQNTGSFGPSENTTVGDGGKITVPSVTVDNAGHVTAASNKEITLPTQTDYTVSVVEDTSNPNYSKTYTFKQKGSDITTINIPKDMVVSAGEVVDVEENTIQIGSDPVTYLPAGKYVKLTIANAESDTIYIAVTDLVDVYTAPAGATEVQVSISAANEITATIVSGAVTEGKLANGAVTTLKIADNAVTNDKLAKMAAYTIKVNNTGAEEKPADVLVKDLILAGYTKNFNDETIIPDNTSLGTVIDTLISVIQIVDEGLDQSKVDNIFTTSGELLVGTGSNTYKVLGHGSDGQVLKVVNGEVQWSTDNDTHYEAKMVISNSADGKSNETGTLSNPFYINLVENNAVRSSTKVTTSDAISVTTDGNGEINMSLVWGTF